MMANWRAFLDSLATRGGNIFLLFVANGFLLSLILHMIHHGELSGALVTTVATIFGNFSGALLYALTGTGGQRRSDNGPEKSGGADGKTPV